MAPRPRPHSNRFRESVHLLPSYEGAGAKRFEPIALRVWVFCTTSILMIAIAVALEVTLVISQKKGGFRVPLRNIFPVASPQFLSSFFPTLLILPLAILWSVMFLEIRRFQPYVVLSKTGGPASETLLLDYVSMNKLSVLYASFRRRHWLIFIFGVLSWTAYLLQPLAGAVLSIRQMPQKSPYVNTGTSSIGLSPTALSLNAFLAAAGFADASAFHALPDPPFIQGGWSIAEFDIPTVNDSNSTILVTTHGVQSQAHCSLATDESLDRSGGSTSYTIRTRSKNNCTSTVTFNPTSSDHQYGIVNVPNCQTSTPNVTLQSVMLWFFTKNSTNGTPEERTVFCLPTIALYTVNATVSVSNSTVVHVAIVNEYPISNNVTGPPLSGEAFNGVVFDSTNDTFVQARATSINSGISGTIFRYAAQVAGSGSPLFPQNPSQFLNITERIYTQHLSIAAQGVYFVPAQSKISGTITSFAPRLVVDPTSAHGLAAVLLLIGVVGLAIHFVHRNLRRQILLAVQIGSIAGAVSLTARSGFGELLLPYDTTELMEKKLEGLRFTLDRRTGAIIADDVQQDSFDDRDGVGAGKGRGDADDEMMMSLLSRKERRQAEMLDSTEEPLSTPSQ